MSESTLDMAYDRVIEEAREICLKRHEDYGPGNISRHGELGVLVRMDDKLARLEHLLGREAKCESIEDSWLDLVNYAVIGLLVHRGVWETL